MPAKVKTLENQSKHMTNAEKEARQAAEDALRPQRESGKSELWDRDPPAHLSKAAKKHWKAVLRRAKDVELLDDLDIDMLGIYCAMIDRMKVLEKQCAALEDKLDKMEFEDTKDWVRCLQSLNSLTGKIQTQERTALTYADKLGLTPSGRAHLARRAAEGSIDPDGEEMELFGDG